MKKILMLVLFCSVCWAGPSAASAVEPMDTVKLNIDKVISVLRNPAYQAEAAVTEKKAALRSISNEMFYWPQLSQMTLGKNWSALSPAQQEEFVALFKEILEAAYIDKILAYKDEKIEYVGNQSLSETKAEVETRILSGGSPVGINYRMVVLDGKWGVYDVIVEGVSLVKNYRTQFREILATKTPAELIEVLRKKVG